MSQSLGRPIILPPHLSPTCPLCTVSTITLGLATTFLTARTDSLGGCHQHPPPHNLQAFYTYQSEGFHTQTRACHSSAASPGGWQTPSVGQQGDLPFRSSPSGPSALTLCDFLPAGTAVCNTETCLGRGGRCLIHPCTPSLDTQMSSRENERMNSCCSGVMYFPEMLLIQLDFIDRGKPVY